MKSLLLQKRVDLRLDYIMLSLSGVQKLGLLIESKFLRSEYSKSFIVHSYDALTKENWCN